MHVQTKLGSPWSTDTFAVCNQTSPQANHTMKGGRNLLDKNHRLTFHQHCLAAATLLLHLLAPKGHARLCRWCSTGLVLHPRFDLTGHGQECLFNIRRSLRGGFQKLNPKPISKLLPHLRRHNTFPLEITLVTNEKFVDIFTCIPVNLMKPLLHIVE